MHIPFKVLAKCMHLATHQILRLLWLGLVRPIYAFVSGGRGGRGRKKGRSAGWKGEQGKERGFASGLEGKWVSEKGERE